MVINHLLKLLPNRLISIIFEFTPQTFVDFDSASKYLENLSENFYLFDLFYSPNPTRFRAVDKSRVSAFVENVFQRQYHYADLFLLDKRTPKCEQLVEQLSNLAETSDEMIL